MNPKPPSPVRSPARNSLFPDTTYIRRGGPPIHPIFLLFVLLIILSAIIAGVVYLLTARSVIISINGVREEIRTHQNTVNNVLLEQSIFLGTQDVISPPVDTAIRQGIVIKIEMARPVVISADGHTQRVMTHRADPRQILTEAGIQVGEHDLVEVDGSPLKTDLYSIPPENIAIERAISLTINDDGKTSTLYTVSHTVGDALRQAKTVLYLADSIDPAPGFPVADGDTITIKRSVKLDIDVDGQTLHTRTHTQTVGEALTEAGIALLGLDYSAPIDSAPVQPDMKVKVVRVTEELQIERSPIDFQQVTRPDSSLPPATRKIVQKGVPGIREKRYTIRRENGVEVSRSAVDEQLIQTPQDEITAIGEVPAVPTTSTP